jgi:hypothetical protein
MPSLWKALREVGMKKPRHHQQLDSLPPVAGNGLIDRRAPKMPNRVNFIIRFPKRI